jgi:hypothetical protein
MTGETIRDLLQPLIATSGAISMVVRRTGHIGFVTTENEKLTGVKVRQTAWCILSARLAGR